MVPRASLLVARYDGHALGSYKQSRILVVGGSDGSKYIESCEEYSIGEDKFVARSNMNSVRYMPALAILKTWAYCFGGYNGSAYIDTVERMDMEAPEKGWKLMDFKNSAGFPKNYFLNSFPISETEIVILGRYAESYLFQTANENQPEMIKGQVLQNYDCSGFYHTTSPVRKEGKLFFFSYNRKMYVYEIKEKAWRLKDFASWK